MHKLLYAGQPVFDVLRYTKGINGRYNSPPDGDCFRDLIGVVPAEFTEKSHPASKEYEDMERSRVPGRGEDG
jgi:hypothetical protein